MGRSSNSTIHGNHAADEGGGIFLFGGRLRISNSTITSNIGVPGGGIASDGLFPEEFTRIEIASSIVASNAPSDVEIDFFFGSVNPLTSLGGNVIGTGNATGAFGDSEVIGAADPMLENLDDYGGPTPTRVPLATSPAIGAGNNPQHLDDGPARARSDLRRLDRRGRRGARRHGLTPGPGGGRPRVRSGARSRRSAWRPATSTCS